MMTQGVEEGESMRSDVCGRGASACCGHVYIWCVYVRRKARAQAMNEADKTVLTAVRWRCKHGIDRW
jgi:hypothetical protein